MSQKLQALLALANAAAETAEVDLSQVSKGGGGGKLYPAGHCLARFVRYIEFGMHPQEYQGKAKDPALEYRLGFALFGEGYQNEDGSPGFISTYDMKISNNEKAGTKIIFDKMNWKGQAKHFAQMLGDGFLVKIEHKDIKDQPGKKRSVLNLKETLPPIDMLSKQPYQIPPVDDDLLDLFLWSHPTKEAWDAMHIEGTNDAGKSKNFLQEKCLQAIDFPGSALEQLLRGTGSLPSPEQLAAMAPAAPAVAQAPATPAVPTAPAVPAASAPVAPAIPAVPQVPSVPQVPAVPAVPQAPVAPAVPQVPQVPADVPFEGAVPAAPEVAQA